MDISASWNKALRETRIIRSHIRGLSSAGDTQVPYIFLAPSAVNSGDTVVRQGEVTVGKPSIILPSNLPQLEGFDFEKDIPLGQDSVINFLLIRGVQFPSLKYNNQTSTLDLIEGKVEKSIQTFGNRLERTEDVRTTLLVGPEDVWQFSLLILIGSQVARSADGDIRHFLEKWRREGNAP